MLGAGPSRVAQNGTIWHSFEKKLAPIPLQALVGCDVEDHLRFPMHRIAILAGVWLALSIEIAFGQDERPADNPTAAIIVEAAAKVQDGKLLDAVEQFQRIIDTAGDELVPVDRHHQAPARWVIQGHLARLPAEGLKLYRQRVDGQAAKRLDEARKSRDEAGLQRLLADMFAAKASEDAIVELARRAFERGDFDAAEHFWRMLLPQVEGETGRLHFPDPKTDIAATNSRLILIKLFRGERDEARSELKAFKEKHADAAGLLAGKNGKYAETLTELVNDPRQTTLPRSPDESGWHTFAGSASRTGSLRTKLPYFWPDVPAWKTPLPFPRDEAFRPIATHPRSLAFHPVISNGRAYIADGARVIAIDLMTGKASRAAWPRGGEETRIPTLKDQRHTLTEHEGILYARFGPAALAVKDGPDSASFILALGARKGETEERDALWKLDPPTAPDSTTHFEGAPVAHRDRLYVAFWRQSAGDASAGIACYRLDEPTKTPELAWQRVVGKAGSEPNGETRYRHALVTISGPNVVYCTDGGSVVALNASDGKPAWEYRYPRNERPTLPRYRDLCPPLADGGRIYAAPADTDRLLCLDAFTGRLIWEREGVEVVHLLGVGRGRLIATFAGQLKGIRGLNLRTGADSGENGWTILDDGDEQTFGRGLVTEESVVWPTRRGLYFLNPADGTWLRSPIRNVPALVPEKSENDGGWKSVTERGGFGNLTYADGVLVVTTATEVWGFISEATKLSERRKEVEKAPDEPKLRADLTQSLIDAGLYADAEKEAAKAGDAKERLLWLLAEKIIRDGDKEGAKRLYEQLAKGDGSFAAAGAVRLAEMTDPTGRVRAEWRSKFPFEQTDQEMMTARAAWDKAWQKKGEILDQHGVPNLARRYAENHSPVPLVMNSLFHMPQEKPSTPRHAQPTFARAVESNWWRPSLRILHESEYGVIAGDDQISAFGIDIGHPQFESVSTAFYLPVGDWSPAHATVILVGERGIAAANPADGKLRWPIAPQSDTPKITPLGRPALPRAGGERQLSLAHFELYDRWLKFAASPTCVAYLDPGYARSIDARRTPNMRTAEFYPHVGHTLYSSIYQLTSGQIVAVGPDDEVRQRACSAKPWPQVPYALPREQIPGSFVHEQTKFLIPDDASVFLFDAKAGKELARYTIPGVESLTGELPRFRMHQGDPLLLIDRNHGVELDRLKIDGLKRAWKREPIFVGQTLDDVAFFESQFFFAADGTLASHDWKDGERVWEIPLPELPRVKWRITVAPQGLLVHPAEAILTNPDFDAVGEFRRAGFNRERLLRAMSKSYDVWTARELPILVIDPADGRLIQRLNFPAAGPAAGVAVTPKGVVVVTGKGSWTLNAK